MFEGDESDCLGEAVRRVLNGGGGRNRTGVYGVAVRCITTLPLRLFNERKCNRFCRLIHGIVSLFERLFTIDTIGADIVVQKAEIIFQNRP